MEEIENLEAIHRSFSWKTNLAVNTKVFSSGIARVNTGRISGRISWEYSRVISE